MGAAAQVDLSESELGGVSSGVAAGARVIHRDFCLTTALILNFIFYFPSLFFINAFGYITKL